MKKTTYCDNCMGTYLYDTNYLNENKEIRCPYCDYLAYRPLTVENSKPDTKEVVK